MSDYIYILSDGQNTKIGITVDFDKRMQSYNTHNANFQLFKSYPCQIEEAKRVEKAIKIIFKESQSNEKAKEWFSVSPEVIDRYVSVLLEKPSSIALVPAMHGVRVSQKAHELQEKLLKLIEHKQQSERVKADSVKEQIAELFAAAFSLGMPEHQLPLDYVVFKNSACIDKDHSASPKQSEAVRNAVKDNYIRFPKDDHVWRFFHLVRLSTGHYVAVCTSRVSMPYIEAIKEKETIQEIAGLANEYGWTCITQNEWSWHYPEKTGLILFQPKTPVLTILRRWENSFRKWVIERQEVLKFEKFDNPDRLEKAIEDTARDTTFPLGIHSYDELREKYLEPFFDVEKEDNFFLKDAYTFLIEKWKREG